MARNIFELGLKTFIDDPAYVLEYADFLVGTNDVANARVLHERAAGACAEAVARAVGEKEDARDETSPRVLGRLRHLRTIARVARRDAARRNEDDTKRSARPGAGRTPPRLS